MNIAVIRLNSELHIHQSDLEKLHKPKIRFRTFSLRLLLVVVAVFTLFAGWWFQPYETDENWGVYSSIRMQYRLRRDIRGRRIHIGPTNLVDTKTNTIIATAKTDGIHHGSIVDWWIGDRIYDYWRTDGTQLKWDSWFQYMSVELNADLIENGG